MLGDLKMKTSTKQGNQSCGKYLIPEMVKIAQISGRLMRIIECKTYILKVVDRKSKKQHLTTRKQVNSAYGS